jgi:hypothetical protein
VLGAQSRSVEHNEQPKQPLESFAPTVGALQPAAYRLATGLKLKDQTKTRRIAHEQEAGSSSRRPHP